MTYSVLHLWLH